jgi:hypothetical protein
MPVLPPRESSQEAGRIALVYAKFHEIPLDVLAENLSYI